MLGWLPAVALYWTFAALYLGGAAIEFEGDGGGRQLLGLLIHFVVFLVVFGVGRALFGAMLNGILATALGVVVAVVLFPITAKITFRIVGVRITSSGVVAHPPSA